MKTFEEKKFQIPTLKGISEKTIGEHLKLYSGYVKNANIVLAKIDEYSADTSPVVGAGEEHAYALSEVQRRFAFEFNGIRNHEIYFKHFEGGSTKLTSSGPLAKAITEEWPSYEAWLKRFKNMALTRGVGWAMLVFDPHSKRLLNNWVDEQHLGQLSSCIPILTLDMWEHSYVADYQPSGKKQYIEDFFENLNWQNAEENFENAERG
ncbi:MAG: Fe-Mn family superoxide dismutase [Patescibacteria group bacterium]